MSASAAHPGDECARCHVVPLGGFREHELSVGCWCGPQALPDAPQVWVHRALDGRERYESGELRLQ